MLSVGELVVKGILAYDAAVTNKLGTYIKNRRAELGMNQTQLAQRMGISKSYLSQIESGMKAWPQKYIPALAEALGVRELDLAIAAGKISPDFEPIPREALDRASGGLDLKGLDRHLRFMRSFHFEPSTRVEGLHEFVAPELTPEELEEVLASNARVVEAVIRQPDLRGINTRSIPYLTALWGTRMIMSFDERAPFTLEELEPQRRRIILVIEAIRDALEALEGIDDLRADEFPESNEIPGT